LISDFEFSISELKIENIFISEVGLPISELKIKDIFKGVLREQDTFFI